MFAENNRVRNVAERTPAKLLVVEPRFRSCGEPVIFLNRGISANLKCEWSTQTSTAWEERDDDGTCLLSLPSRFYFVKTILYLVLEKFDIQLRNPPCRVGSIVFLTAILARIPGLITG